MAAPMTTTGISAPSEPASPTTSSSSSSATQEHFALALAIRGLPSASLRYLIEEMQAADAGALVLAEKLIDEAFPARMKDPRYPLPPSIWQLNYADLRELALALCLEPGGKAVAIAQLERVRHGKDGRGRYLYDLAREKSERKRRLEQQQQQQQGTATDSQPSSCPTTPATTTPPSSCPTTPRPDDGEQQQKQQEAKKKAGKRYRLKKMWNEILLSQEFALGGPFYQSYS